MWNNKFYHLTVPIFQIIIDRQRAVSNIQISGWKMSELSWHLTVPKPTLYFALNSENEALSISDKAGFWRFHAAENGSDRDVGGEVGFHEDDTCWLVGQFS